METRALIQRTLPARARDPIKKKTDALNSWGPSETTHTPF